MENEMLNLIVTNKLSVIERELAEIVRSLRVQRVQSFDNLLVLLFGGKLLLVNAAHIGLVHDEIVFVLNVV